jgi:hypothetical protein
VRRGLAVGEEAIAALAELQGGDDAGASSYWREMHEDFAYRDGRLSGKLGFGTISERLDLPHRLAHALLQAPIRRCGAAFPAFRRIDALARDIARRQRRIYDLGMLRQALTVAYVDARVELARTEGPFLVIGDGYGVLTALLLAAFPARTVILANLTQTLLADFLYIRRALADAPVMLAADQPEFRDALGRARGGVIGLRADDQALAAAAPIAAAFNVVSMQEMAPAVIARYFDTLRRAPGPPAWFYCCNRVEKTLPDGTVVRFASYPWRADDEIADDGPCPWHRYYYAPAWPVYRAYDGPTRHRLARLAKAAP